MEGTLVAPDSVLNRQRWPLVAFQFGIFFSLFGINPTGGIGGEGSILRQAGWAWLGLICILGAYADPKHWTALRQALSEMRNAITLLAAFWLLAMASSLWAEIPFVTFKRAILLGVVLLICTLAAATMRVTSTSLADLLVTPLFALLLLSILFSALVPRIAFTDIGWQGITGQKNSMGQLAAILILALWHGRWAKQHAAVALAGIMVALAALALSRSSTAIVALFAAAVMLAALRLAGWLRHNPSWGIALYALTSVTATALFVAYLGDWLPSYEAARSAIFDALGKSENLTGRTKLWDLVMAQDVYRSEIIGGGYGGFWDISYERILYIMGRLGFPPIQAHNGYLDIFNDLGYLGLGVTITILASHVFFQFRRDPAGGKSQRFHLAFATYFILANFSESSLLRTTQFLNLLFLVSFLLVAARPRRSPEREVHLPTPA